MYSENLSSHQTEALSRGTNRVHHALSLACCTQEVIATVLHEKTLGFTSTFTGIVILVKQVVAKVRDSSFIVTDPTTALEMNVILEED